MGLPGSAGAGFLRLPRRKVFHTESAEEQAKFFSTENTKKLLDSFNRACNGNFYMVDYCTEKIIAGSAPNQTICGYSKKLIEKENLSFYKRILSEEEFYWLVRMNREAHDVFYSYPESERKDLEFTYTLVAHTTHHEELVLHHKLVPFELCKNGNLWLALCFVSAAPFHPSKHTKASITHINTGEKHNFINGKFVKCNTGALTSKDIEILEMLGHDVQCKQICTSMNFSESCLKRKKHDIYTKLGVNTSAGAVYKAKELGLI